MMTAMSRAFFNEIVITGEQREDGRAVEADFDEFFAFRLKLQEFLQSERMQLRPGWSCSETI